MVKLNSSLVTLKNIFLAVVLVAFVIPLLSGCVRFKIGDKIFDSPEEALNFQSKTFSEAKSQIAPVQNRVGGKAMILIPSDDELLRNYVNYSRAAEKEHLAFPINTTRNFLQFQAEAITIRRIFDSVEIKHHDGNPANTPIGENDFLIFFDVDGCFIKGKNKPGSILIPQWIPKGEGKGFNYEVAQLVTYQIDFLEALNQKADQLRAK